MKQVVEHIRRMRGGAQSHLMRCEDGGYYVVKFQNNPQGVRVLANELLATRLAARLGLPTAPPDVVHVPQELITNTEEMVMQLERERVALAPGAAIRLALSGLACGDGGVRFSAGSGPRGGGKSLRFDYGYRNGVRGFLHAVAIGRDPAQAKVLAYTAARVRVRIPNCAFTAVTESDPAVGDRRHAFVARLFEDSGIGIVPLNRVERFAEDLKQRLQ
jgi:HipA-like kinase